MGLVHNSFDVTENWLPTEDLKVRVRRSPYKYGDLCIQWHRDLVYSLTDNIRSIAEEICETIKVNIKGR